MIWYFLFFSPLKFLNIINKTNIYPQCRAFSLNSKLNYIKSPRYHNLTSTKPSAYIHNSFKTLETALQNTCTKSYRGNPKSRAEPPRRRCSPVVFLVWNWLRGTCLVINLNEQTTHEAELVPDGILI